MAKYDSNVPHDAAAVNVALCESCDLEAATYWLNEVAAMALIFNDPDAPSWIPAACDHYLRIARQEGVR